ncbi:outer membrane protein transport protein [Acinetobacter parvus]|uniref:outer membrane protein transport protein n=1 Tax=Acinetobacter parvus TaxID=134533 RepID=UPI0021CD577D|nr:outer membrane protein transport protein [Acinetobacter parvus]MCU4394761.1 outer membrane protein transport protein [Acinetobacter parvus]MCU4613116.1 outer membrane protein transport protein [Acinetobacter parvus]
MKLKYLSTAMVLATLPATGAFAAALDRSGQSMSAFLQPGNYFEAGLSVLDPTVEGKEAGGTPTQRKIGDMGNDYMFPSAALKLQLTDKISFGLLYDQPFGADAKYTGENVFVSSPNDGVLSQKSLSDLSTKSITQLVQAAGPAFAPTLQAVTAAAPAGTPQNLLVLGALQQVAQTNPVVAGGLQKLQQTNKALTDAKAYLGSSTGSNSTQVEVDTQNISMVFGFQPNKNLNFYAGPVIQTIKGNVSLRGQAWSVYNGYDAKIKETTGLGWLAGAAYQIPEIALKASLTYRSEIDHDATTTETLSLLDFPALQSVLAGLGVTAALPTNGAKTETKITTPQSVNLDFQTGIMANTVAFANVRWVNWKDFSIQPYTFGQLSKALGAPGLVAGKPNGFNLVEYSDDQWSVNTGIGRKLNEQWAGNVSVGWDSGAGNPVTTLGPTEGYWNVGFGVQYSPTPATFISGGVKYFWLGDAKAQTGAQSGTNEYVATFEDNNAIAYGLKMGYRF